MTVLAPEFLQTTKYSAQRLRAMQASMLLQEGIVENNDFQVKQRGAGANMSVDIAAGDAWVQGDNTARQGYYHVGNDATINVAIPAAHATLPRVDQVVLRIYDSTVIGGEKDLAAVEVVSGTATAGATLSNLTGAAALPSSAIRLGYVLVGAAVTKIETANIGNLVDPRRGLSGYPASVAPLAVAGAPPQYAHGRPLSYVPAARAVRSSAQAITAGATEVLTWNAADDFDTEGIHDPVTNNSRLTVKTPGLYYLAANLGLSAFQGPILSARVNGVTEIGGTASSSANAIALATPYRLGSGDYVEFRVFGGGGAFNVTGAASITWQAP